MKWRIESSKWILLAVLVSCLLLGAGAVAGAQTTTTLHFKAVNYEVTGDFLPVGDPSDGHFVGFSVRRGLTTFETGEVSATSSVEFVDATKGVGSTTGYVTNTFDDGSSFISRIENHFSVGPNGLFVALIKGEYIKGTGRFAGICHVAHRIDRISHALLDCTLC